MSDDLAVPLTLDAALRLISEPDTPLEELKMAEETLAKIGYEKGGDWIAHFASSIKVRLAHRERSTAMRVLASLERLAQEHLPHAAGDWITGQTLLELLIVLLPEKSWPVFDLLLAPGFRDHLALLCTKGRFNDRFRDPQIRAVVEYISDSECISGDRADRIIALGFCELDEALTRNPALPPEDAWRLLIRYLKAGSSDEVGRVAAGRADLLQFLMITERNEEVAHAIVHMERVPESVRPRVAREAMSFLKTCENTRYYEKHVRLIAGAVYRTLGDLAGEELAKFRSDEVAKGLLEAWQGEDDRTIRALARHPRKVIREALLTEYEWRTDPKRNVTLREVVLPILAEDRVKAIQSAARRALSRLASEGDLRRGELSKVTDLLKGDEELPEGRLSMLLDRARMAPDDYVVRAAILAAASRPGLSLDRYKAFASLRWEPVTLAVIENCAKAFPEAEEFLKSLMDQGEHVMTALFRLGIWNLEERAVFLNHPHTNVRRSLASGSPALTRPEIIALLSDENQTVRIALVFNPAWSHYVTLL